MCGISGIVGFRPDSEWRAWAMQTHYRGPDALGIWSDENAVFCHNRLSIIDLSELSNQPMLSEDGRFIIVFNGEIFNYASLRDELKEVGHDFRTNSDTEVLLIAFIEWGESVLDHLDGMFAFAIWDCLDKNLFCARDHAGIKPFFYGFDDRSFIFGSEIKLILNCGLIPKTIRRAGILDYLAYSYIPAPRTAYEYIWSLMPGEKLSFNLNRFEINKVKWWTPPVADKPIRYTENEAKEEFVRLFSSSVSRRLISDVPVGAFLSGGVDSSLIVAEMVNNSAGKVKTFTIGYSNNAEYDESSYAEEVANYFGVEHQTINIDDVSKDLETYLELIVNHFDQPYGNPTVTLTHILTHKVRDKVTVALIGDGGDELFGGYPRYWALGQQERFGPAIRLVSPLVLEALECLSETPSGNHFSRRLRRFFSSSNADLGLVYEESLRLFSQKELLGIVKPEYHSMVRQNLFLSDLFRRSGFSSLSRACNTDIQSFLPYNLLEGADRMSMANSFELRLPFLDRDLMMFASILPDNYRIRGRVQKWLLKQAYKNTLPSSVFSRPKRGFNPPVWHWLKSNPSLVQSLVQFDSAILEFIDRDSLIKTITQFQENMRDNSTQIWSLLVLNRWLIRQTQ